MRQVVSAALIAKFNARVDRSGELDDCWPWTGAQHKYGYGQIRLAGSRSPKRLAHHMALMVLGISVPEETVVRHTCDNPPCCNSTHLRPGTHQDNIADKIAKNRQYRPVGVLNRSAVLTPDDVREIRRRAAAGDSRSQLALDYHVGSSNIGAIVRRKSWKEVV